jgi:hypothetical protein
MPVIVRYPILSLNIFCDHQNSTTDCKLNKDDLHFVISMRMSRNDPFLGSRNEQLLILIYN